MLPFLFVFFTYSEAGRDAQVLECINYCYIQFSDVCKDCGHLVATHKYSFSSDDEFQVWLCSLVQSQEGVTSNYFTWFSICRIIQCSAICVVMERLQLVFYQMTPERNHFSEEIFVYYVFAVLLTGFQTEYVLVWKLCIMTT